MMYLTTQFINHAIYLMCLFRYFQDIDNYMYKKNLQFSYGTNSVNYIFFATLLMTFKPEINSLKIFTKLFPLLTQNLYKH